MDRVQLDSSTSDDDGLPRKGCRSTSQNRARTRPCGSLPAGRLSRTAVHNRCSFALWLRMSEADSGHRVRINRHLYGRRKLRAESRGACCGGPETGTFTISAYMNSVRSNGFVLSKTRIGANSEGPWVFGPLRR